MAGSALFQDPPVIAQAGEELIGRRGLPALVHPAALPQGK